MEEQIQIEWSSRSREKWMLYLNRTWLAVHFRLCTHEKCRHIWFAQKNACASKGTLWTGEKIYRICGYLVVWHSILIRRWLNIFRLPSKCKKERNLCKEYVFFTFSLSLMQRSITGSNVFRIICTQFENLAWSIRL